MKFDLQSTRPAGIPTWFIARQHRFTTGIHWRYGAVLTDSPTSKHLALIETPPSERFVTLSVRGPSPHSFFVLLKDGLELTFRRFPGLEIRRSIPCPGHPGVPKCGHEFDYTHLVNRIERVPPRLRIECPAGYEEVSVTQLLFGINWTTADKVLERIESLQDTTDKHFSELERANEARKQQLESHLEQIATELADLRELTQREFTNLFNRDQRLQETHCPRVFCLRPQSAKSWPILRNLFSEKWSLQLYCEAPGFWHPTLPGDGGLYVIECPSKWVKVISQHVQRLVKVLKFVTPIAGAWLTYSAKEYANMIKNDIGLMKTLVDKLPEGSVYDDHISDRMSSSGQSPIQGGSLRGLRNLLDEVDASSNWGNLQKVLTPEGHYLWLCSYHARAYLG